MNLRRVFKFLKPSFAASLALIYVFQAADCSQLVYAVEEISVLELLDYYPPSTLAKVTDSYDSGSVIRGPLVINIQDLHAHPGVQRKISQILEYYSSKGIGTSFVAVEGAQGPIDTTLMALFPDEEIKREVSEHFMKEGVLTGMEDYAIRNAKPEYLYGVDDQETYQLHKELFRETLEGRSKLASEIQDLQKRLKDQEPRIYSRSMIALGEKTRAYQEGKLSLAKYLQHLEHRARTTGLSFPNELQIMQDLLKLETNISGDDLKEETKAFLTYLNPRLTQEETEKIATYAKEDSTVYYLFLNTLAKRHHVLDSCPKRLRNFLAYTQGMQSLDMQRFQTKLEELARKLLLAQAKTQLQKNLVQAQRDLSFINDLVQHKLTEDDFKTIFPRTNELLTLIETLLGTESPTSQVSGPTSDFKELLAESIDFYALALVRDKPLVEHTLDKLSDSWSVIRDSSTAFTGHGPRSSDYAVAVLVTGGFHSAGVARLLKQKNISYLTISPIVDSYTEEDQKRYIRLLTEDTEEDSAHPTALTAAKWVGAKAATVVMAVTLLLGNIQAQNPDLPHEDITQKAQIPLQQAYAGQPQGVSLKHNKQKDSVGLIFKGSLAKEAPREILFNQIAQRRSQGRPPRKKRGKGSLPGGGVSEPEKPSESDLALVHFVTETYFPFYIKPLPSTRLSKPFEDESLVQKIKAIIDEARKINPAFQFAFSGKEDPRSFRELSIQLNIELNRQIFLDNDIFVNSYGTQMIFIGSITNLQKRKIRGETVCVFEVEAMVDGTPFRVNPFFS